MKSTYPDDKYGVYQQAVLQFVRAANELVGWLEQPPPDASRLIREGREHLSSVYHLALFLHPQEAVYEEGIEREVTEQDWAMVYHAVARVLGPRNSYLRMAGEDEYDRSDLVTHTISEDLADIYQELRDFTAVYSSGTEELMNDAVWQVSEAFREHWGTKLLLALTALHRAMEAGDQEDGTGTNDSTDHPENRHGFFSRFQDQAGEDY